MIRRVLLLTLGSATALCFGSRLMAASRQRRAHERWERLLAYGQTRMRARLRTGGLELDRMNEDDVMQYVYRVNHKYRE